jgi:integrase
MNDLRFVFTTPDKKIPSSLTILDGKLTVYKRSQSAQWQCRFKLSNGKWHSASCATTDLESAKQQAIVLYETVKLKVDAGLAIHVKTFGHIAREEITRLARVATTRQAERKYKDYLFILEKYLIPFFGNYRVADITDEVVAEFSAWRLAVMGKEAKAMTKKHHAMAFNRIVQIARERHYVYSNHTVPQLDITGAKSEPRPAFSNEEMQQLYAYAPIWQKDVIHKDSEAARILCTAYVKFLVNTGVRHSTESMPLRWKHLQWHYIGSKRYLRIWAHLR